MLVLSRKVGEEFVIGHEIRVRITRIKGKRVRVAIMAPTSIPVQREELYRQNLSAQRPAPTVECKLLEGAV